MIINHNMNAMNAHRNMGINNTAAGKSMEKLSSGLRINRAGDDAAGLAISEKMRGQIRGLDQASRNAQDGISLIQTAEGALNETQNILQRMRELSVQGANDTNAKEDRDAINAELQQLHQEIDRISQETKFNGKQLIGPGKGGEVGGGGNPAPGGVEISGEVAGTHTGTVTTSGTPTLAAGEYEVTITDNSGTLEVTIKKDGVDFTANVTDLAISGKEITAGGVTFTTDGTYGDGETITFTIAETTAPIAAGDTTNNLEDKLVIQVGANAGEHITIDLKDMSTGVDGLNLNINDMKVDTVADANKLTTALEGALTKVSTQRASFGATQNRLEHTIKNLDNNSENLQAAESRIRDVDMAKEMLNFSKNNILNQAAQSMLAQAKSQPEGVLQLLR